MLVGMIEYGVTNNTDGSTVTLHFHSNGMTFVGDGVGMGCFLFDASKTYPNKSYTQANVSYSSLISLPSNTTLEEDCDFVINGVADGTYYIVVSNYDENNIPLFSSTEYSERNSLDEFSVNSDMSDSEGGRGLPYPNPYDDVGCKMITIPNENNNVWYGKDQDG